MELKARSGTFGQLEPQSREDQRKGLAFDEALSTPPGSLRSAVAGWQSIGGIELHCSLGNLSSLPDVSPIEDLQAVLGRSGLIWAGLGCSGMFRAVWAVRGPTWASLG